MKMTQKTHQTFSYVIHSVFGWMHNVQGVPLEALSLDSIVPFVSLQNRDAAAQAAKQVVELASAYIHWRQAEHQVADSTLRSVLRAFNLVAKFQYRYETADPTPRGYTDIPVITALRELQRTLSDGRPRVTNKKRKPPFALKPENMPRATEQELEVLHNFLFDVAWPTRQGKALREPTADLRILDIHRIYGWLHSVKQVPLEELRLSKIVSFASPADKAATKKAVQETLTVLYEYTKWLREERECHPASERFAIYAFVNIAKHLYQYETDYPNVVHYRDIPVINFLRAEAHKLKERAKNVPPAADLDKKWLPFELYLRCVEQLKGEMSPRTQRGGQRSKVTIAKAVQRYLLFGSLGYLPPDRQRTLRELEVGRTLVKGIFSADGSFEGQDTGLWYIHLLSSDYKTGDKHGEQWLEFPKNLYPELEAWLYQGYQDEDGKWQGWRQALNPQHAFVFCQTNGKPFTSPRVTSLFQQAAFRITGKALNPHLVRSIVITHFFEKGASDAEMNSLAIAMRHSRKAQQQIYDKRQPLAKVVTAQNMMLKAAKLTAETPESTES